MRKLLNAFTLLFFIAVLFSCSTSSKKMDEDMIQYVGQPRIELDKTTPLFISFKKKPDEESVRVIKTSDDMDIEYDGDKIESNLESDGDRIKYEGSFSAGSLGKANFPIIEAKFNGKTYRSRPFSMEVVDTLIVDSMAVRTVLSTDKQQYRLGDTITLSLFAYSKFIDINRLTPSYLVEKGAPDAIIPIIDEGNVDYKVGIPGFKKYIDANFNVTSFDWNADQRERTMATLNNDPYIKELIFEIRLLAKRKGTFTIDRSSFDFKVYMHVFSFKQELLGPNSKETLKTKNRIHVKSNALDILVQ